VVPDIAIHKEQYAAFHLFVKYLTISYLSCVSVAFDPFCDTLALGCHRMQSIRPTAAAQAIHGAQPSLAGPHPTDILAKKVERGGVHAAEALAAHNAQWWDDWTLVAGLRDVRSPPLCFGHAALG
jgi:hypothetical protein